MAENVLVDFTRKGLAWVEAAIRRGESRGEDESELLAWAKVVERMALRVCACVVEGRWLIFVRRYVLCIHRRRRESC